MERGLVVAIAVAGALGVTIVGHEPTALGWWNPILTFVVSAGAILLASRSRRWTWLIAAPAAAVLADSVVPLALGVAALGFAFVSTWRPTRRRWAGAAVCAASLQSLARVPDLGIERIHLLILLVAVGPMCASGYQRVDPATRRMIVRVGFGVLGFCVLATALATFGVVSNRDDIVGAVDDAQEAIDLAADGRQDQAAVALRRSAEGFESVDGFFSGPLGWPARFVPVVGHNVEVVRTVAANGRQATTQAASSAETVKLQDVVGAPGTIDLDVVAEFGEPLDDLLETMTETETSIAGLNTVWVLPELDERTSELTDKIAEAKPDISAARLGVRVAPTLLGAEETANYLVIFGSPGEARALGGFIPVFAILQVDQGEVSLTETVSAKDLLGEINYDTGRRLPEQLSFPQAYNNYRPAGLNQNLTATGDFPTVARAVRLLEDLIDPTLIDGELSGAIYMDPFVIQELLGFTGPVEVEGLDFPVSSESVVQYLLEEQYLIFENRSEEERREVLGNLLEEAFGVFTSQELPAPREISDVFGLMADEERLLLLAYDPLAESFFTRLGVDGSFPMALGGDLLGVSHSNKNPSKIDVYLERSIDYDVLFDPTSGSIAGDITVTLDNQVPDRDLPFYLDGHEGARVDLPDGVNRLELEVHSPHQLTARIGNRNLPVNVTQEYGVNRYAVQVEVQPRTAVDVVFEVNGRIAPAGRYSLQMVRQPVVAPDELSLSVSHTPGWVWEIDEESTATVNQGVVEDELSLSGDTRLEYDLERN